MKKQTKIRLIILVIISLLLLWIAPGIAQTQFTTDLCVTYYMDKDGSVKEFNREAQDKTFILTDGDVKLISVYDNNKADVYELVQNRYKSSPEEIIAVAIPPSGNTIDIVIDLEDSMVQYTFKGNPVIIIEYRNKTNYE